MTLSCCIVPDTLDGRFSSADDRLATLDTFLDSQRQLLTRTQSDLHKLACLREHALADPEGFIENVDSELDNSAFRLSEYVAPERPDDIDWDLFTSLDPSPFATISLPGPPPMSAATKQRSPPSELQTFVREASKNILADFRPFIPVDLDETQDAEADAADEKRLAELVKHGKMNNAQTTGEPGIDGPPVTRRRVGSGLRLKHGYGPPRSESKGKGHVDKHTEKQTRFESASSQVRPRPQRIRKPRVRADEIYQTSPSIHASPIPPSTPSPLLDPPNTTVSSEVPEPVEPAPSEASLSDHSDHNGPPQPSKAKRQELHKQRRRDAPSETFNLPWSLSEQHLLEKLLSEIPAGEKQRWAKISKAMSGKRTPRQVASRVQKYFEKLKKFGVEPG